jgi:hypothetical protein
MPAHRPHHHARRALAASLAIAALTAPAANAAPAPEPGGNRSISSTEIQALGRPSSPVVTRTTDDGFDWGSAAVGAGGATAIALLALAASTAATRPRARTVR